MLAVRIGSTLYGGRLSSGSLTTSEEALEVVPPSELVVLESIEGCCWSNGTASCHGSALMNVETKSEVCKETMSFLSEINKQVAIRRVPEKAAPAACDEDGPAPHALSRAVPKDGGLSHEMLGPAVTALTDCVLFCGRAPSFRSPGPSPGIS